VRLLYDGFVGRRVLDGLMELCCIDTQCIGTPSYLMMDRLLL